jgi:hypothetical protein
MNAGVTFEVVLDQVLYGVASGAGYAAVWRLSIDLPTSRLRSTGINALPGLLTVFARSRPGGLERSHREVTQNYARLFTPKLEAQQPGAREAV